MPNNIKRRTHSTKKNHMQRNKTKNNSKKTNNNSKKTSTRRRTGGFSFTSSLKKNMTDGVNAANKKYNESLEQHKGAIMDAKTQINDATSKALEESRKKTLDVSKKTLDMGKEHYNKQKYSSPSSFAASKVLEVSSKNVSGMGNQLKSTLANSIPPMKNRFNPNGMSNAQVENAAGRSASGVPQASQYPEGVVATTSPTAPKVAFDTSLM